MDAKFVKIRMFQSPNGTILPAPDGYDLTKPSFYGDPWVSDIVEVPVHSTTKSHNEQRSTSMDLLKFDLEIAKREPERVRSIKGDTPTFCVLLPDDSFAIQFPGYKTASVWKLDCDISRLRLAPKTRLVKVRVWRSVPSLNGFVTCSEGNGFFDDPGYIGEGEIEVRDER